MALASMTGFSRVKGALGPHSWSWELSGVNGKGLDIRIRVPQGSEALDAPIRAMISAALARGTVTATLSNDRNGQEAGYRIDEALLRQIIELTRALDLDGVAPPRMDGLLALRGVLLPVTDIPLTESERSELEGAQISSFAEVLAGFVDVRREEGVRLTRVLVNQLDRLDALTAEAQTTESLRPEALRERLTRQVDEILTAIGEHRIPEDRLTQELALIAVKTDVREELDRLKAHIASGRDVLAGDEPAGRRLDFLSQELNREANTLCSKAQDLALTRIGLEMKTVINQFREQISNLE